MSTEQEKRLDEIWNWVGQLAYGLSDLAKAASTNDSVYRKALANMAKDKFDSVIIEQRKLLGQAAIDRQKQNND
jgi:hypothetical protein